MKILLIIDTKKYKYHNELYVDFEDAIVGFFGDHSDNFLNVFDMSVDESEHEKYAYVKNLCSDLMNFFLMKLWMELILILWN